MTVKKALISQSTFDKIKKYLKEMLPQVSSTCLDEAIARGLGFRRYHFLRQEFKNLKQLGKRPRIECDIDDDAFEAYLRSEGHEDFQPYALSRSIFDSPVANTTFAVWAENGLPRSWAPYSVPLAVYTDGPSAVPSPEFLQKLNSVSGASGYFGGPDDIFAEIHKNFVKNVIPKRDLEGEEFLYRTISSYRKMSS